MGGMVGAAGVGVGPLTSGAYHAGCVMKTRASEIVSYLADVQDEFSPARFHEYIADVKDLMPQSAYEHLQDAFRHLAVAKASVKKAVTRLRELDGTAGSNN